MALYRLDNHRIIWQTVNMTLLPIPKGVILSGRLCTDLPNRWYLDLWWCECGSLIGLGSLDWTSAVPRARFLRLLSFICRPLVRSWRRGRWWQFVVYVPLLFFHFSFFPSEFHIWDAEKGWQMRYFHIVLSNLQGKRVESIEIQYSLGRAWIDAIFRLV